MLWTNIDRLARKIDFVQEKHLKIGYFCVHESGLPDFGRTWTQNGWQQVNFRPTPENLEVWRFRIERTRARYIFVCGCTEIWEKIESFGKTLRTENIRRENFWSQYPRNPYALRIQKI